MYSATIDYINGKINQIIYSALETYSNSTIFALIFRIIGKVTEIGLVRN